MPLPGLTPGNVERAALQTALTNLAIQVAALTAATQNPQSVNLQALTDLSTAYGCVAPPRPDYTEDGVQQNYAQWLQIATTQMEVLRKQVQQSAGPFQFRSRRG